ncbi:MAG: hypothetical protein ACE5H4_06115 [Candidatus Thorarchaeota archaeon]
MLIEVEMNWRNLDWLENARNLLIWLANVKNSSPALLAIRRSHREVIRTFDEMAETGITELGHDMAREFGKRIPVELDIQILHSFIPRCRQTAESIAEGFRDIGGTVKRVKSFGLLIGPRVIDLELWNRVGDDGVGVASFVNDWADGLFPQEGIEPFGEFKNRLLKGTIGIPRGTEPGLLHTCVTHDLFLVIAKSTYLRLRVTDEDRPPFLGGFGLVTEAEQVLFYEKGAARKVVIGF